MSDDCFDLVVSRVLGLRELEEDEPEEYIPTDHAIEQTLDVLREARPLVGNGFPRAAASVHEGSVFLYWQARPKSVQLTIGATPDGKSSIYHREGRESAIEHNPTAERLAHWLRWYQGASHE